MNGVKKTKDLIVLAADADIAGALTELLRRKESLQIRAIQFDVRRHPEHDPGCLRTPEDFLRPFSKLYNAALVVFDRSGCGRENKCREDLEADVEAKLRHSGWRALAAVAIDPELETWVWSDSPNVDAALGWATNAESSLRDWLRQRGLLPLGTEKPLAPRDALEAALRKAGKGRSAALYSQLARSVGIERCVDPSFLKLKATLQLWFGELRKPG